MVRPMEMNLENLELSTEALQAAREEIQRMAYSAWERAGRPQGDPLVFWREAERDWIYFHYVPNRHTHGGEPPQDAKQRPPAERE